MTSKAVFTPCTYIVYQKQNIIRKERDYFLFYYLFKRYVGLLLLLMRLLWRLMWRLLLCLLLSLLLISWLLFRLQLLSLLLHDMGRRGHVKRRGINRTTTTTTTTAAAAVAIVADISVTSVTAFMGCGVGI